MVVGLLGNKSPGSNRFTLVAPKPENGVRLQAKLGNQNPTGLLVGVVRGMYETELLDNIKHQIKEQQRETRELADDFYKQFDKAFSEARDANEHRYQSMKKLTEQKLIGNAMETLRFGLEHNQFGDNTAEMQDVYNQLSTRVIEQAKEFVRDKSATKTSQRGTEFDDMLHTETAPALDVQLD